MAAGRKLLDIPREYLILMMEIGYVLIAMKRLDEAKDLFEGISALAPKSDVPVIALGNVHSAHRNYDKAVREYKKAIKLNPSSALAYAHIGESYLLKEDIEKGKEFIQKAINLDPNGTSGNFARSLLDAVEKGALPFSKWSEEIHDESNPEIASEIE